MESPLSFEAHSTCSPKQDSNFIQAPLVELLPHLLMVLKHSSSGFALVSNMPSGGLQAFLVINSADPLSAGLVYTQRI